MLDVATESSFVEVANEVECEVGSVGGAFLGDSEHAVVVHLLELFNAEWSVAPALVVDGVFSLFLEHGFWLQILVLESSFEHLHQACVVLLILLDSGHLQVGELEEGFEVLNG